MSKSMMMGLELELTRRTDKNNLVIFVIELFNTTDGPTRKFKVSQFYNFDLVDKYEYVDYHAAHRKYLDLTNGAKATSLPKSPAAAAPHPSS